MLAWYEDIKNLTEKTGNDRDKFVKRHSRHMSSGAGSFRASDLASLRGSRLSMGTETAAATREPSPESEMGEDEADTTPYHRRSAILNSAKTSQTALPRAPDSTTTSLLVHARTTPHLTISPGPISTSPTSHPASMVASEPRSERGRFVSDVSAMHTDARDLDTSQLGTSMSSGDSVIGRGRDRDSLGDIPTMPGSRTSLDVPTGRNSLDIPSPVHPTRSRSSLSNRDTPISPTSPSFPSQSSSLHTPASRNDAGSDQHYTPPPQSVRTQPSMESTRRLYHARGSWSNEKVSNLASIPDADPPSSGKKDDPLEIEAPPPKPLKYRHTVPLAARETSPSKTSPASPLSIGPSSEKANSTHTTFYTPITSPPDASAVQSPQVERLKSGASTPATGATATATGPTESVTTIPAGSTNVSSIGAPVSSCTSYDSTAPRAKDDVGLATPTTPGASGAAERRSLERPMPQAPSPLRMHVESESPSQQAADDSAKHHG
ncbi:hypothetical protein KEM55_005382 [Ascosphaera atra]|nr:hypothetical protein KEM55_005382 [Ascosphaera atra]